MKIIRVLLVDDHAIIRAGLRALLQTAPDIQVIGEAENGHQAVREAQRLRPDIVVLDLAMPLLNGVGAARQIAKQVPTAKVLILSSYNDAQHLRQAIEAGAAGYLTKESAGDELLEAVRETCNGGASFSPLLLNLLRQWSGGSPGHPAAPPLPPVLSWREDEVLQLIAEGFCNKQIGSLLSISGKTVEQHRLRVMKKLDMHKTAALTRYAVASGLVPSNRRPDWPTLPPLAAVVNVTEKISQ
jgi:DNA-binding NarL/FixJ family response regulator